jgi:hypothetical protein
MERGKWTSGPWLYEVERDLSGDVAIWTRQPHTGTLAMVFAEGDNGDYPAKANARLIAAAPALYEALEAVTQSTEWSCMEADIQSAALAALAQARGEQP